MRVFTVVLFLTLVSVALSRRGRRRDDDNDDSDLTDGDMDLEAAFEEHFNILISDERERAREARELRRAAREMRRQNARQQLGLSKFSERLYPDSNLPVEEFKAAKLGLIVPDEARSFGLILPPVEEREDAASTAYFEQLKLNRANLPSSYESPYVTSVKNQRSCGSCAAFASAGVVEGCMKKVGGFGGDIDLAEQQMVDCAYNGNTANACNGATPHAYLDWLTKTNEKEMNHELDYPYENTNPGLTCQDVNIFHGGARVASYHKTYSNADNDLLKQLVLQHGSVLTALRAEESHVKNYNSGIIDQDCDSHVIDHAVIITGWGVSGGQEYWIVKNSWGTGWGENGYFRINFGLCGIGTVAVAPECTYTGQVSVEPVPPPTPVAASCDVSGLYGPGVTGRYYLRLTVNGVTYEPLCSCQNSVCTPEQPTSTNACMDICGGATCPWW